MSIATPGSWSEGWTAGEPQKLIKGFPSPATAPGFELSVWIKVDSTEIKRRFSHPIDVDHYLTIFDRDWATLQTRADKLPKNRDLDGDLWFDITIWFERPGVELQDNTETLDPETGRAFVRMVFDAWESVA